MTRRRDLSHPRPGRYNQRERDPNGLDGANGMSPTPDQIAVAAYHRWRKRAGTHGGDRDDWVAAEKDLTFGLNYRYLVRLPLVGPIVRLGQTDPEPAGARRCRYCEQAEPSATFERDSAAVPSFVGNQALMSWDECDDCRASFESHLAGPFEAFARPWIEGRGASKTVTVAAWKALVRMALAVMPAAELDHFGDAAEWVANPDHARDAVLLAGQGCHVYATPAPIAAPFVALARRVQDNAPWPYALFFLASGRAVFQTHLPLCPRDDELDDLDLRGPVLSMSLGSGAALRGSDCTFLPVESPRLVTASGKLVNNPD